MDPLSGLALAGNIIQFIDFGCKLFAKAGTIHKDGAVAEYADMQLVNEDLRQLTKGIRDGLPPSGTRQQALTSGEIAFLDICEGCLKVAEELEQALKALRILGKKTRWKSFRQALKTVWGKERLTELKARLDLYSEQMDRHSLASMSTKIDAAMLQQGQHYATLDASIRTGIDRTNGLAEQIRQNGDAIDNGSGKIVKAVERSATDSREDHKKTQCAIEEVSTRFQGHSDEIRLLARNVIDDLKSALQENRQQHADTLMALVTSRQEGLKQTQELKEEIRELKTQVEESFQQIVISVGHVSLEEELELKNARNAKYSLWLAKEIVLSKILEHLKLPTRDWVSVLETVSIQVQSFTENWAPANHDLENWGTASDMDIDFAGIPGAEDIPCPVYEAVAASTVSIFPNSDSGRSVIAGREQSIASHMYLSGSDWAVVSSSCDSTSSDQRGSRYASVRSLDSDYSAISGSVSSGRIIKRRLAPANKTTLCRSLNACVRCRLQRSRCRPDPVKPWGPCLTCQERSSRIRRLPCLRFKLGDARLFRTLTDSGSIPRYKIHVGHADWGFCYWRRWVGTSRILHFSQLGTSHLQLELREFSPPNPTEAGGTEQELQDSNGQSIYSTPWAIRYPNDASLDIIKFLSNSIEEYLDGLLDDSDKLVWDIFQVAYSSSISPTSTDTKTTLLPAALRIWVACRFLEGGWRPRPDSSTGSQAPDIEPLCFDWKSMPPFVDYQFTSIITEDILRPFGADFLRELQSLFDMHRTDDWFPIFLTSFILLHNYEVEMKFQAEVCRRTQSEVSYLNMPLVRAFDAGANTILAHFHYYCKGLTPFKKDFDWDGPTVRRFARLDYEQIAIMKTCRDRAVEMAERFETIRRGGSLSEPYWYTSQLFESDWRPRDTFDS
ncbi:hypothetical protein CONLIGDRAFT_650532 [Coniochaeta ligniaria NRRL 30616]|uniref:Fungal N-terminal domain-containing protein n=1 Tax=Coniochaeta ligniaria NRRL 30616 TaxID=1408157 RepID=A0A1J7J4V1_9PEZI|nr:hypothetical protein CONLIGDRAFT_650532 [Coniochaeta ligniaria NRRL 30616]